MDLNGFKSIERAKSEEFMKEQYETLELRRNGGLLWLILNRPQSLNALNRPLVEELHDVLDELHADQSIRVVILRGAGRAFCAGLDLKHAFFVQLVNRGTKTTCGAFASSARGVMKAHVLIMGNNNLPSAEGLKVLSGALLQPTS